MSYKMSMTKPGPQTLRSRTTNPPVGCGVVERTDLDQREMDAIWSRFSVQQGQTGRDRRFRSLAHPMAHWVGECHVRPVEMHLLEAWRHPATPRDMSIMHGLHIEVVRFIADEMLMIGLMDDMEDGRFITNDEGIVHTRSSPDERAAMHALITSSTGSLYFDEIQMRTQIKDHVAMTRALAGLAGEGLVRSAGILYEIVRIPLSSR